MTKPAKKYSANSGKVDSNKRYALADAVALLKSFEGPKFDETVDLAVRLGVDPKQSDQNVRGAISLPHGIGKTLRVVVFAKGDKADEAKEAGADAVGAEDLVEKILGGWTDFDNTVATPDMMGQVGKLGKVLGPRGLMPNPKLGTVTVDVKKVVKELKGGRVEFRVEKEGIVQAPVGKKSFDAEKLTENIQALMEALLRAKPPSSKGIYLQSITVSATQSPGIKIDPAPWMQ